MQQDLSAKLEERLGRVHARQRLGIEKDYEQTVFGHGINFFHIENWYSIHSVIRNSLKLAGLYWRGCKNAERVQIRHNLIQRADIPSPFDGFTILHISDMHADISQGALHRLIELLASGPWKYHNMLGYTSVGVGSCVVAVRLNCPPEITLHHLQA